MDTHPVSWKKKKKKDRSLKVKHVKAGELFCFSDQQCLPCQCDGLTLQKFDNAAHVYRWAYNMYSANRDDPHTNMFNNFLLCRPTVPCVLVVTSTQSRVQTLSLKN